MYNLLDVAKDTVTRNLRFVEARVAEQRLAVCRECEHLLKLPNALRVTGNCKKCGCFMDAKVKFAPASCPVGKWKAEV